jgi:amidohydrolase
MVSIHDAVLGDKGFAGELREIRRQIHRYPELAFKEHRTSRIIADYLRALEIEVYEGIAHTGVKGVLRGSKEGGTVALRADMDALPIQEISETEYRSNVDGVMHACGHDAHIACCLGAAKLLTSLRDEILGNIVFLFQPAEEVGLGARMMIDEGALMNPKVDAMFALHVWPHIESGYIGIRRGTMFAASDKFKITVVGQGGHGAHPHHAIDPISAAAQIYFALQTLVSREQDPLHPLVLSVCEFNAGTAYNIIPDKAQISGTVRSLHGETREKVRRRLGDLAAGIADSMRCIVELEYEAQCDMLENNDYLVSLVEEAASRLLGVNKIVELIEPSMGCEDCGFFFSRVPGAYFRLGIGNFKGCGTQLLHTPTFDLDDEKVLAVGAAVLAQSALNFLTKYRQTL